MLTRLMVMVLILFLNIIQCVLGFFSWAKEVKAIPLLSHTPLWRIHGELHIYFKLCAYKHLTLKLIKNYA